MKAMKDMQAATKAKKKPVDQPGTIKLEDGTLAVDAAQRQQR